MQNRVSTDIRITSCRWRTNDRYAHAGAGTSHECRDEARTAIFDSAPSPHASIVPPFPSPVVSSHDYLLRAAGRRPRIPKSAEPASRVTYFRSFQYFRNMYFPCPRKPSDIYFLSRRIKWKSNYFIVTVFHRQNVPRLFVLHLST